MLAAILLLAPIRAGDLAGYDDARYALVAKHVVLSGHWLEIESNGGPALEHPPLFSWMQAALFIPFGLSDPLAKLPSALCGLGVILLVAWLGRRLTGDPFRGVLAMFVTATIIYFIKYAARAMTDVPFTFFFLAAVCAWVLAEDDPRWFLAAGAFAAMAQLTRALAGISIPLLFAIDLIANRRRPPLRYLIGATLIAFIPPAAWYAQWIYRYGEEFFLRNSLYMNQEVTGELSPAWRRYTGAFEYIWMIFKSYWPWLPAMIAGIVFVIRKRDRKLRILILWIAVVYVLCAITKSRVLRYMLPAYPAFAILSAIGLSWLARALPANGLRVLTPPLAMVVLGSRSGRRSISMPSTPKQSREHPPWRRRQSIKLLFRRRRAPLRRDERDAMVWRSLLCCGLRTRQTSRGAQKTSDARVHHGCKYLSSAGGIPYTQPDRRSRRPSDLLSLASVVSGLARYTRL